MRSESEKTASVISASRKMVTVAVTVAVFAPVYKLLDKLPAVRNISNKIIVLKHV